MTINNTKVVVYTEEKLLTCKNSSFLDELFMKFFSHFILFYPCMVHKIPLACNNFVQSHLFLKYLFDSTKLLPTSSTMNPLWLNMYFNFFVTVSICSLISFSNFLMFLPFSVFISISAIGEVFTWMDGIPKDLRLWHHDSSSGPHERSNIHFGICFLHLQHPFVMQSHTSIYQA